MNLPNKLTVARILLAPLFLLLMMVDFPFHYLTAGLVFGAAALTDMFDGKIARATKRTKDAEVFGIQIDSLCDLVSFGVLPSAIGHAMGITGIAMAVLMFYTLCAVIRLGYFNVTEQKRQETTSENRTSFEGLPVTWSAVIVPLVSLVRLANESIMPWVMGGVLFIVGFCFIARIRVKKPQI